MVLLRLCFPKEADDLFASVFIFSSRPVFPKYIQDAILLFWEKQCRSSQAGLRKRPVCADSPLIQTLSALGSHALEYRHTSFIACINECLRGVDKSQGIVFFARQKRLMERLHMALKIYPQQAAFTTAEDKSTSRKVICSHALWKGNHSVRPLNFQMLITFP